MKIIIISIATLLSINVVAMEKKENEIFPIKSHQPVANKKKKRGSYVKKACRLCQSSHQKCDGSEPCKLCVKKGGKCIYDEAKTRGPKKYKKTKLAVPPKEDGPEVEIIGEKPPRPIFLKPNAISSASAQTVIANHVPNDRYNQAPTYPLPKALIEMLKDPNRSRETFYFESSHKTAKNEGNDQDFEEDNDDETSDDDQDDNDYDLEENILERPALWGGFPAGFFNNK